MSTTDEKLGPQSQTFCCAVLHNMQLARLTVHRDCASEQANVLFSKQKISRRELGVTISITMCGICYEKFLHTLRHVQDTIHCQLRRLAADLQPAPHNL